MEYLEAETAKGIGREADLIYHGPLKAHLPMCGAGPRPIRLGCVW